MNTYLKSIKTPETQKVAPFTGEGAYHGSSNKEHEAVPILGPKKHFVDFSAHFQNVCEIKKILTVPTQEQIQNDGVVFVWATFDEALREAGPVTKNVLQEMQPLLKGDKKYIYVDSKIQFFQKGDLPVDSRLWHVDGSIAIRGERAWQLGYTLLHDLKAQSFSNITNHYLAYQSSEHSATQWATEPLSILMPERIPSFDIMDERIQQAMIPYMSQPAGSIIHFTDNSLHRAVPASGDGWRLWLRVLETNKEITLNQNIIECYGTVFRPNEIQT